MVSFSHHACYVHWIALFFFPLWINFSSVDCFGKTNNGRRVAILVACEQYHPQLESAGQKKLESPREDMKLLEKELKHLAYEVRRVEGDSAGALDKGRIASQLEEFISGIQVQDEVLVYLSGHGVQLYGDRYDGLYFVPE
ncbi:MAG: caspase family protein, partial [Candidatus Fonsibacter sp.]